MGYLQLNVMEHQKLIEKHAAALGINDVKVSWFKFNGPTAVNEALISGNVDIGSGGVPGLLTLWSRTKGTPQEVRGISALSSQPFLLNTRDPNIKSVAKPGHEHRRHRRRRRRYWWGWRQDRHERLAAVRDHEHRRRGRRRQRHRGRHLYRWGLRSRRHRGQQRREQDLRRWWRRRRHGLRRRRHQRRHRGRGDNAAGGGGGSAYTGGTATVSVSVSGAGNGGGGAGGAAATTGSAGSVSFTGAGLTLA